MKKHGIIIETTVQGNAMKVTAIDEATGIEAAIVADPRTSRKERERLAMQKLEWVMKKKGGR